MLFNFIFICLCSQYYLIKLLNTVILDDVFIIVLTPQYVNASNMHVILMIIGLCWLHLLKVLCTSSLLIAIILPNQTNSFRLVPTGWFLMSWIYKFHQGFFSWHNKIVLSYSFTNIINLYFTTLIQEYYKIKDYCCASWQDLSIFASMLFLDAKGSSSGMFHRIGWSFLTDILGLLISSFFKGQGIQEYQE
jgi:hypothetical protein